MARTAAPRRLLLAALSALVASTGGNGAADVDVQHRLSELEVLLRSQGELIQDQQRRLTSQQDLLTKLEDDAGSDGTDRHNRRLQTQTKSIHGAYDASHIAYTEEEKLQGALASMWLVICGAIVLFMQAGFTLLEAGVVRAKSIPNAMMKHLTHVCVGTIAWFICGWALGFGGPFKVNSTSGNTVKKDFIGHQEFLGWDFLVEGADSRIEPTDKMQRWFFSWAQCIVAAAIVSGGLGERANFVGYAVYSLLMTAIVYPLIVATTWGGGFIYDLLDVGASDFGGSGIIHICGGTAALVGAAVAGPRRERFEYPEQFLPSNLPLVVLGTLILWFGWYALNCGVVMVQSNAQGFVIALIAMNTTLSASVSGLTVFLVRRLASKRFCIQGFCNGILAGLVGVSAGSGSVTPWAACAIGCTTACVYMGASGLLLKLKVDDPVDAFAVHGAAGMWGVLIAPLLDMNMKFTTANGRNSFDCIRDLTTGSCRSSAWGNLMVSNVVEMAVIFVWVALWSMAIFFPLRLIGCLKPVDVFEEKISAQEADSSLFQPAVGGSKPTLHAI